MKQENILLRSFQSIQSFFKPFFVSKSDTKHNVLLAKWDAHYSTNPNEAFFAGPLEKVYSKDYVVETG